MGARTIVGRTSVFGCIRFGSACHERAWARSQGERCLLARPPRPCGRARIGALSVPVVVRLDHPQSRQGLGYVGFQRQSFKVAAKRLGDTEQVRTAKGMAPRILAALSGCRSQPATMRSCNRRAARDLPLPRLMSGEVPVLPRGRPPNRGRSVAGELSWKQSTKMNKQIGRIGASVPSN